MTTTHEEHGMSTHHKVLTSKELTLLKWRGNLYGIVGFLALSFLQLQVPKHWAFSLVIELLLIYDSVVFTPAVHFRVMTFLGMRTGRVLLEGPALKIPLFEQYKEFQREQREFGYDVNFISKDNLSIDASGNVFWEADPFVCDSTGKNKHYAVSQEVREHGVIDKIESVVAGIGGNTTGEDFKARRKAVEDAINAVLRLEKPPHLNHDANTCSARGRKRNEKGEEIGEEVGCYFNGSTPIEKLLDFYSFHWEKPKHGGKSGISSTEAQFGINIVSSVMPNIRFSKETRDAFEQHKQAELQAGAFKTKVGLAKQAMTELDISGADAMHAVDITLEEPDKVTKKIVTVQGGGQAVVVEGLEGLLGSKKGKTDHPPKDSGKGGH